MELVPEFANSRDAAVIAAAGCGKTNLIAFATAAHNTGRELILTHTHAGVYAIATGFANSVHVRVLTWLTRLPVGP